jgi:hypothetical protein
MKRQQTNRSCDVQRDFTPLQNENAPREAFELLAERVGFEPTVPCSTPDFESGTFDHSATSPGRKRLFPKDRDCIRTRLRSDTLAGRLDQGLSTFTPPI